MCGIAACMNGNNAGETALSCLKELEYRGYDSAGIAIRYERTNDYNTDTAVAKCVGPIDNLKNICATSLFVGKTIVAAIAHTRWATHGEPNEKNAHPHFAISKDGKIINVVHNGIVENYAELRDQLRNDGRQFSTDTDTEVIATLLAQESTSDNLSTVFAVGSKCVGSNSFVAMFEGDSHIYAYSNGTPLIVARRDDDKSMTVIASDVLAILDIADDMLRLEDKTAISVGDDGSRQLLTVSGLVDPEDLWTSCKDSREHDGNKRKYDHAMLDEIHEQSRVLHDVAKDTEHYVDTWKSIWNKYNRELLFVGCGTSYNAALTARQWFFESGYNANVEIASDALAVDLFKHKGMCTAIFLSQSGETLDTSLCARDFNSLPGRLSFAMTNRDRSTLEKICDRRIRMNAGEERSVASTKCYLAQLAILYLLSHGCTVESINDIKIAASAIEELLVSDEINLKIKKNAQKISHQHHVLYIGRGISHGIAREGALKMKEISYIHAESFQAGELKHGPLALVTKNMHTVALCLDDRHRQHILTSMNEISARHGKIIVVRELCDTITHNKFDDEILFDSKNNSFARYACASVILQLLAYEAAILLNRNVDMPRNLAKTVTTM